MFRTKPVRLLIGIGVLLILLSLAWTVSAFADTPPTKELDTPVPDQADSLAVVTMFTNALASKDFDAAAELLADDLVFVAAENGIGGGKAEAILWLGLADYDSLELTDIWIRGNIVKWTVRIHRGSAVHLATGNATLEHGKIKYLAHTSW